MHIMDKLLQIHCLDTGFEARGYISRPEGFQRPFNGAEGPRLPRLHHEDVCAHQESFSVSANHDTGNVVILR